MDFVVISKAEYHEYFEKMWAIREPKTEVSREERNRQLDEFCKPYEHKLFLRETESMDGKDVRIYVLGLAGAEISVYGPRKSWENPEVFTKPSEINWSAFGSVSPYIALIYASAIQYATELAVKLDVEAGLGKPEMPKEQCEICGGALPHDSTVCAKNLREGTVKQMIGRGIRA